MDTLKLSLSGVEAAVEGWAEGRERWQIVAGSATLTLAAMALRNLYANRADVKDDVRAWAFRVLRSIPAVQKYIKEQLDQSRQEIQKGIFEDAGASVAALAPLKELPKDGWSEERVLEVAAATLGNANYAWQDGKISGGAFSGANDDLSEVLLKVYGKTALTNPLHADIFPGVRKMEAEIVRMTLSLFHGDEEACGCVTSGGSESILMAMKAMRDYAREVKGVRRGEVVMAITGHSGFDKGASLLGMKIRKVPVDPVTFKTDVNAMRKAINRNTVMLVASAPEFPHGIIDDVEAIGALGLSYGVPVHVDCCMGGFLMPFMGAAGFPLPPFDFRVPGVTSISADTHKYGQAHKGSSVVMYRSPEYRHYQYFVTPDWPGGIYGSPTIAGSRPGGLMAVCWAALLYHGVSGYTDSARRIISTARDLKQRLQEVPGIQLFGDPLTSIVAFRSSEVNILAVGDLMTARGWHLTFLQYPPGLHVCLTNLHTTDTFAEDLVKDLKETMNAVRLNPQPPSGVGKVYGTAASIPDKSLIEEAAKIFLTCYYETEPVPENKDKVEEGNTT
ncbi:sphingosine-1-phosphate lyase-like [Penaeus japonicus]|uniref:sphingosine-1-phosphate lyase-like n=1 Tax=Penaeus japonicus TaxID=27405 RepID=UPI001C714B23|nr:sphingosine-1-phosphate lyase-like [Penaeus japonicus]